MMRKFVQKKLTLLILLLLTGTVYSYSQLASNKGKEFWVGFGHHIYMESDNSMTMVIYLSAEEQAATVTVTVDSSGNPALPPGHPAGPWTRTYNLAPYTAISTEPIPETAPWDARLWDFDPALGGTGGAVPMRKKGIHIVSTAPITAYAHIYGGAASGATMLMPVKTWGYEYVVLSSNQNYGTPGCYSWMYVVASEDNTVIEVTPSVKTKYQNVSGLTPGSPKQFTLMKGHILQVRGAYINSDANGNEAPGTGGAGYNLSGTRVKSIPGPTGECKPIAVFSGSSRTANPITCGSGGGDNDNQQLFPMHAWGKKYLTSPFAPSTSATGSQTSMVRVAFKDPPPATILKRNGVPVSIPNGSLFYTYESNSADYLEANNPIMVNQFMTGGSGCMTGGVGDPEMVVVAPVEQAIKQVVFYKNNMQDIDYNYLNIIVPTAGVGSLRIDNSSSFDHTYPHPRNALLDKPYTVVVKRWTAAAGQCVVTCDSAFNAITYGLGSVESYAYSAGAQVVNLNALNGMHNQPDTAVNGTVIHEFTGVGTPMDLTVLMKYQPERLTWKFSEMSPNTPGCLSINPPFTGDFIMNPASSFYEGSILIDGTTYYKYKLPQTFTFNCPGIYELPLEAYSPGINNCGSTEYFEIAIEVKPQPITNFTFSHPTKCTKDTVYLTGQISSLSGTTPMILNQWKWLLPGGVVGTKKDTAIVLPPGIHTINLIGVTVDGLLTDTVTKTITVLPPPTLIFDANPDTVCLGQAINFTQTATYGDPTIPIINHYWDFGDNSPVLNGIITSQVHTYTNPGPYTAIGVVKVSTLCTSDTAFTPVYMSPEALISLTYPTGCLPASGVAQFTAAPTDLGGIPIVSYNWNFGDPASGANNTSTAQNPSHVYSNFGTYPVTLTVLTNTGCGGDTTINMTFGVKPALNYPALSAVCVDAAPFSVGTATVTNGVTGTGTYSGPGITDGATGSFSPAVAGPGTHTITYSYVTPACTETITQTITVNALPTVSAGTYTGVCVDAAAVALNGTPAGGTFSGPGVSGTSFNPATAGAGTHVITYTYTDPNGCSKAATSTITVNALPTVNAGTYNAQCINGAPISLIGTPAGGTFTGPGVTGSNFYPSAAGAGTHTIIYSFTNANGCTNTNSTTITVNALPVVNAGTYAAVCVNAGTVTLAGTPAGGTFSGTGVTGTTFNPATAGPGTYNITYNYTASTGCANSSTTTITVNALPTVDAGTYAGMCINATPITLAGTPTGGTFSGPGVSGTTFSPAIAGLGTHTITYNFTAANGCANSSTTTINVYNLPTVVAGTYPAVCIDGAPVTLAGTPAGGTFSGPGVSGNSFNPAIAGAGTHTLTYSFTDPSGCTNSGTTTITVNPLPVLNAGTYPAVCINGASVTLAGTPTGGTFSGPGVTGNTFNPATAGVGTHTITYGGVGGCNNTITTTITVNPLPTVNAGTYNAVCVNGAAVTLAGNPAGGTFSGPGVTGNSFNPVTAGVGTHTITYNYTAATGCSNSATTTISVEPLPTVSAGTYTGVCINSAAVTLVGNPAGGTFSGTGVTGNNFDPATAGVGPHTITYTYTNATGCTNTATATITVNALPTVNAGTYAAVCVNGTAVTLAGNPAGGTFSGTGVTGNSFNPATAGVGTHTITYTYTDANSCANSATTTITVNALPTVNAGTYAAVCVNGTAVALAGTPAGGTFSGPGVTGSSFNPATAGAGTHTITYTYTDANGCTNSGTTSIVVNALPVVSAGTYTSLCEGGTNITLIGSPAGGTFSGPGVTGNSFDPIAAGIGTHTITYNYTDGNGCSNSATTTITVNPLPSAAAGTYPDLCEEAAPITLNGAPGGGTFSGPGVSGNVFNPALAGPGIHNIVYSYTSSVGCSRTNSTTIEVFPRPTASFTLNNSICLDGTSTLTSTSTISSGSITNWKWDLGDGNAPSYNNGNPFNISYTNPNTYTIQLVTVSDKGCVSATDSKTIAVHALPAVDFNLPGNICMPGGNAQFTNTTTISDGSSLTFNWNFGDGNTSGASSPSHLYAASGAYTVTLDAISAFGCVGQQTKTLSSFFDKPVAFFTVNPQEICQGQDNNFSDASTPAGTIQSWSWNFKDGTTSTSANPVKKFNTPGVFDVSLTVKGDAGCVSDPFVLPVTVHLQPKIDAGPSFVVPMGTQIQFGASANSAGLNFSWTPPLGLSDPNALKPTLIANDDQQYTLTATGDYGCTATDFLTVKILKPVVVPNIFTPNGDNIHDRWVIQHIADYPGATVEVFNRYGQQVFFSAGYATPWDGRMKGKDLPVGTYYYVIKLNNGFKMLNGSVTIVR